MVIRRMCRPSFVLRPVGNPGPRVTFARMRLAPFRVGSVPYLNAAPLTWGVESEVAFLPPSELARELHAGRLDAALVSVTEALFHDGYDLLDDWGITSHGPVFSVFLAHREPLDRVRTVHLDPASCTSVNLLRVLLAERGWQPEFKPLTTYAGAAQLDNVLLIGNPAIEFRRRGSGHQIWDLGEAWRQLTGLPFVYAAWALRRDVARGLKTALQAVAEAGSQAIPEIIAKSPDFDAEFRRAYVGGHIRYRLCDPERAGLRRFAGLLARHTGRRVHPPQFVR